MNGKKSGAGALVLDNGPRGQILIRGYATYHRRVQEEIHAHRKNKYSSLTALMLYW
jgi:hypothetical protein